MQSIIERFISPILITTGSEDTRRAIGIHQIGIAGGILGLSYSVMNICLGLWAGALANAFFGLMFIGIAKLCPGITVVSSTSANRWISPDGHPQAMTTQRIPNGEKGSSRTREDNWREGFSVTTSMGRSQGGSNTISPYDQSWQHAHAPPDSLPPARRRSSSASGYPALNDRRR